MQGTVLGPGAGNKHGTELMLREEQTAGECLVVRQSSRSHSRGLRKHKMELGKVVRGFLGGLGQEGPDVWLWGEGG